MITTLRDAEIHIKRLEDHIVYLKKQIKMLDGEHTELETKISNVSTNGGAGIKGDTGPAGPQGPPGESGTGETIITSVFTRIGDIVAQAGDYSVGQVTGAVPETRQIIAGTGLTGGGPLTGDITLSATGGAGMNQTPWLSNIDGGGFNLSNVGFLHANFISHSVNTGLSGNLSYISGAWKHIAAGSGYLLQATQGNQSILYISPNSSAGADTALRAHVRFHDNGYTEFPSGAVYVTATNIAGADIKSGLILDRPYNDIGDTMDILWPAMARISAAAVGGGEGALILYAQTGGGDGTTNELIRFNGNHTINIPAGLINSAAKIYVSGGTVGDYNAAPIQIHSVGSRISFHWPGMASQIGISSASDPTIRTFDNPGTGYENFKAKDIGATGTLIVVGTFNGYGYQPYDNYPGANQWLHSASNGVFHAPGIYSNGIGNFAGAVNGLTVNSTNNMHIGAGDTYAGIWLDRPGLGNQCFMGFEGPTSPTMWRVFGPAGNCFQVETTNGDCTVLGHCTVKDNLYIGNSSGNAGITFRLDGYGDWLHIIHTGASGGLRFQTNSATRMEILNDGNVNINNALNLLGNGTEGGELRWGDLNSAMNWVADVDGTNTLRIRRVGVEMMRFKPNYDIQLYLGGAFKTLTIDGSGFIKGI